MSARASQEAQWSRVHLPMQEMQVQSLVWEDPLEKEMETHSGISAWEISRAENLGSLQGCKEVDTT